MHYYKITTKQQGNKLTRKFAMYPELITFYNISNFLNNFSGIAPNKGDPNYKATVLVRLPYVCIICLIHIQLEFEGPAGI